MNFIYKISISISISVLMLVVVSFSCGVYAQSVDFQFESIGEKLKYKNQMWLENIVDTGVVSVLTNFGLTSWLENEIIKNEDDLLLKMIFTDINLDFYKRQLKIANKEPREFGSRDKEKLENELREGFLHQWINLSVSPRGKILEFTQRVNSNAIDLINLNQTAEQFFINFPEEEIEVGHQWEEKYTSTMPSYDQGQPFVGATKYTYLGEEEHSGILCYKVKATLFVEEERNSGDNGSIRVSRLGTGTLYFAVAGKYLVESSLSSDLSLLVTELAEGEKSYRTFIRTKLEQKIELVQVED